MIAADYLLYACVLVLTIGVALVVGALVRGRV